MSSSSRRLIQALMIAWVPSPSEAQRVHRENPNDGPNVPRKKSPVWSEQFVTKRNLSTQLTHWALVSSPV